MQLDDLNKPQQQAVQAGKGNHLVLAGAGSGKTRVLVYRIAWLIQKHRLSPDSILAVTFTNKAAAEMRQRINRILNHPAACKWIGTFHAINHKLLRIHHKEANLIHDFHIMDAAEQRSFIKRLLKRMNLDDRKWPPKLIQSYINNWKEAGLRSSQVETSNDYNQATILEVYVEYEKITQREHLVDFAELLLRSYEMLSNHPALLKHYQKKFQHILIDEFQDTNSMQCAFIQLLKSKDNQVMAVGDEDQSIYGWRGTQIGNILNFDKLFPPATIHRLEQNYRSTNSILQAANAVISHNKDRLGKKLWTQIKDDYPIQLYQALDDKDEALFIAEILKKYQQTGNLADCAIFYRVNAQSRILEESLVAEAIPYRIYGGLRFYERAEIKHVLAYMRLLINRHDYESFIRIINMPRRGLGNQTLAKIIQLAESQQASLWQASHQLVEGQTLANNTQNHLHKFLLLIDTMDQTIAELLLKDKIASIIKLSGLEALYKSTPEGETHLENLAELINAAAMAFPESKSKTNMAEFVNSISLDSGDRQAQEYQDAVNLMTLHAAKGLEFPTVFMIGMEEGLLPLESYSGETKELEEERRLCYVGITRTQRQLYLSCTEVRQLYGRSAYNSISRFVEEIPEKLIHQLNRPRQKQPPLEVPKIKTGQRVMHSAYGYGVVKGMEGQGEYARIEVDFETEGHKWLVLQYAELQLL